KRMNSSQGLPKSMEERFVRKALEAPVLGQRSNAAPPPTDTPSGAATPQAESADSQSSVSTANTSTSGVSKAPTAATSVPDESDDLEARNMTSAMQASDEVVAQQRLRVGFNFICSSYVPPPLAEVLKKLLADGKGNADFTALDDYLIRLSKMKQ